MAANDHDEEGEETLAVSGFDPSNPFCKRTRISEASSGPAYIPTPTSAMVADEPAGSTVAFAPAAPAPASEPNKTPAPVARRKAKAGKNAGRASWIKTPSRPIADQIKLQQTMVEKSDQMLQLMNSKAPLSALKEARKSRVVEKFRLETLTLAKARKPKWAQKASAKAQAAKEAREAMAGGGGAAAAADVADVATIVPTTTTNRITTATFPDVPLELSQRNVTLSGISIPLTGDAASWSTEAKSDCDFFVMINAGTQVACTDIVTLQDGNVTSLDFKDSKFIFENLDHDFELEIQLYASKAAQESKKKKKNAGKKMLSKVKKFGNRASKMFDHDSSAHHQNGAGNNAAETDACPQYEKIAATTITLKELLNGCHTLSAIEQSCYPVRNQLIVNATIDEPASQPHCEGFLTMFAERKWTRYWAVLHRDELQFWTNRRAQRSASAEASVITMVGADSQSASKLARSTCARANCFALNAGAGTEPIRLLCDSREQRHDWIASLNVAVAEATTWPGWATVGAMHH
jgi:hypothetical protein